MMPFRRLSGFSLVELLVVMAIILILAAISFPAFFAARRKAKITACQTQLAQTAGAFQGLEARGLQCPYPEGPDSTYYTQIMQWTGLSPSTIESGGAKEPPAEASLMFCPHHLKQEGDGLLKLPLEGKIIVMRYPGGVQIKDAKSVERYKLQGEEWVKIPETQFPPTYPEMWRFPGDPWPPPVPKAETINNLHPVR